MARDTSSQRCRGAARMWRCITEKRRPA